MKHHDRPWKCSFPGCEFAEGGFLSRAMRDDHLDRFHQKDAASKPISVAHLETDELLPFITDIIRAEKVDAFRALLPKLEQLRPSSQADILERAVSVRSPTLLQIIPRSVIKSLCTDRSIIRFLQRSIECGRVENFSYLLQFCGPWSMMECLPNLLRSRQETMYNAWYEHLNVRKRNGVHEPGARFVSRKVINATGGEASLEEALIRGWNKDACLKRSGDYWINDALRNVASSTCSIRLAKYLIENGAGVNHKPRSGSMFLTPLHLAARRDTAAAAELIKYLLLEGANPNEIGGKDEKHIYEEKGAQNIAKWLGISWDSLVASICPTTA